MVTAVACYCRVSTESESQASSLENQNEFFREFLARQGIGDFFMYADEGVSGTKLKKRRAFMQMLADARLGKFNAVFVKDISRFSRNTLDFLTVYRELKALGIRVCFVGSNMDSSEVDEAYLTILAAMAQAESANTSKRIKFSKDLSAKKGRVPNFVYGYNRIDKYTLTPDGHESAVVREVFDLYANRGMSAAKIAERLNALGIPTKKNGLWRQGTISDMLKNQLYIGNVINHKSAVADFLTSRRSRFREQDWLITRRPEFAIVDEDLFRRAQAEIARRGSLLNTSKSRHSPMYPFSNLLYCSECGLAFRRCRRKYSAGGEERVWWSCSTRSSKGVYSCRNATRLAERELHDRISELLDGFSAPNELSLVEEGLRRLIDEHNSSASNAGIRDIQRLRRQTLREFESGRVPLSELTQALSELESREKKQIRTQNPIVCDVHSASMEYLKHGRGPEIYDNNLLRAIFEKIVVRPDGDILLCPQSGGAEQTRAPPVSNQRNHT